MLNTLTTIARYLVGLLFIFSGLIKANDPVGFSYKLEEYFIEFGMNMPWLLHLTLPFAMFLVVLEVVLGVATITGYRMKMISWALLLLILFFTGLTFASAQFEIVRSCGCFGDAIPLTPWESFYKDLILLVLTLIIFARRSKIEEGAVSMIDYIMIVIGLSFLAFLSKNNLHWYFPFLYPAGIIAFYFVLKGLKPHTASALTTLVSLVTLTMFTLYCYSYLPVKDFRAYAVGKSIPQQMESVPDKLKYIYNLKNKATGEMQSFDKFPENYENEWEYIDFKTEVIEKGIEAKIHDFSILNLDGSDYAGDILEDPGYYFLVIAHDLKATNTDVLAKLNEFGKAAEADGHKILGLTAGSKDDIIKFRGEHSIPYEYWQCDQTTLKTMIRSNPGLMLLKEGTVMGAWHYNSLKPYSDFKEKYLK